MSKAATPLSDKHTAEGRAKLVLDGFLPINHVKKVELISTLKKFNLEELAEQVSRVHAQ